MSYESNLEKALAIVKRNEDYINQIKASGFTLPDTYNYKPQTDSAKERSIVAKLYEIKKDPNRKGISKETLEHIQYLFNRNVINSRASVEPMNNSNFRVDVRGKKANVSINPLGDKKRLTYNQLNKYGEMFQNYITDIEAGLRNVPAHPAKGNIEALQIELDELARKTGKRYDITQLTDINKAITEYNNSIKGTDLEPIDPKLTLNLVKYMTNVVGNAPLNLSPYKDTIKKEFTKQAYYKTFQNWNKNLNDEDKWTDEDIDLFTEFVDSSTFFEQMRNEGYESDAARGIHEIRDFMNLMRDKVLSKREPANMRKLKQMLRNGTPFRVIETWLRTL